jgi:hypothetical protein
LINFGDYELPSLEIPLTEFGPPAFLEKELNK